VRRRSAGRRRITGEKRPDSRKGFYKGGGRGLGKKGEGNRTRPFKGDNASRPNGQVLSRVWWDGEGEKLTDTARH